MPRPISNNVERVTLVTRTGDNALSEASINSALPGDNTIVSGLASQAVKIYKIFIVFAAAVDIKLKDGAGTDLTGFISMNANGSFVLDFDGVPWFTTSHGNAFILNLSSAAQASGRVYYERD